MIGSWRTALRVARREARRSKGRSALVVAMIALPVLCLSFVAVSYDMFTLTGAERADRTMGAADARINWPTHFEVLQQPDPYDGYGATTRGSDDPDLVRPGTAAELTQAIPGSTVLPLRRGSVRLHTVDGIGDPNAISVDASSPLTRGYVELLSGRAPTSPTEVALTEQAMRRLGAGIGQTIRNAIDESVYTVVGQVEFPSLLGEVVLFAPIAAESPKGFTFNESAWLVDAPAPISWSDVVRYNRSGMIVASRAVLLDPPPDSEVPFLSGSKGLAPQEVAILVLIAGLALLEVVLLAGPAFAVSARRRQRQLALVAANGGTPAHIRRIVLADGLVLGAVGALAGIVLGIAAAFLARPVAEAQLTHFRAGSYRVFPIALACIAGLAVVTGLLAALVPAFITARQNVLASLAGRRGITRSKKRWLALGLTMVAAGTAIAVFGTVSVEATVILAGLVVGELGLVLCTPAIIGLIARAGRILPLVPRLALRDAARNRAAAAPAISAVMAAVAGTVALGTYLESSRADQIASYVSEVPVGTASVWLQSGPDQDVSPAVVENALRSTLPVSQVYRVSGTACVGSSDTGYCHLSVLPVPELSCPWVARLRTGPQLSTEDQRAARADPRCDERVIFESGGILVDDGTALTALTGATGDDLAQAQATLRAGGVVVRRSSFIKDGKVTLAVIDERTVVRTSNGPPADPRDTAPRITVPGFLLTGGGGSGSIVSPGAVATAGFTTELTQLVATTTRMPTQAEEDKMQAAMQALDQYGQVERGGPDRTDPRLWLLVAASVAITIGAAGVGTGLAAADGRADLSTLAAVGASPRVRRGLSLSQSGVISVLGSVPGVVVGLGTAIAVITTLNLRYADIWPGSGRLPLAVPWISLLVALVGAPLVAILGAGLLTRSRLPIERRL